ncbi:hypothetical protein V6N11_062897 [Hibiscus sabdariffa]|uniref:Uncharacterized protein n=1 Tax=Hibiscus sabdariffa TaxID=183260 RepID=A0ABR2NPJ5_9ROSI
MVQKAELGYLKTIKTTLNRRLSRAWASVRQYDANQEQDVRYRSALRRVVFYQYHVHIESLHIKKLEEALSFLDSELAGKTLIQVETPTSMHILSTIMVQKAELGYLRTIKTTLNRRLSRAWASVRQYDANQEQDVRYRSALRRVVFYQYHVHIESLHIKKLEEALSFLDSELAGKTLIQVETRNECLLS